MRKLKIIPLAFSVSAAIFAGVSSVVILKAKANSVQNQDIASVKSLNQLYVQDQSWQKAVEPDDFYKDLVNTINTTDVKVPKNILPTEFTHKVVRTNDVNLKNISWTDSSWNSGSTGRMNIFYSSTPVGISFSIEEKSSSGVWNSIKKWGYSTTFNNGFYPTVRKSGIKWETNLSVQPQKIIEGDYIITYELAVVLNNRGNRIISKAVSSKDFVKLFKSSGDLKNLKSAKLNSLTFDLSFNLYQSQNYEEPSYGEMGFQGNSIESNATVSYEEHSQVSGFSLDRIYIKPDKIEQDAAGNSKFTFPTLSSEDWANRLKLYDPQNKLIDASKITYSNFQVDNESLKIKFKVAIKNSGTDYYDPIEIAIPLRIVNLDSLIRFSRDSSTLQEHLQNAQKEVRDWTTKPSTKIVINDEYLDAISIVFYKDKLLQDFNQVAWLFSAEAAELIKTKINDYSINKNNYIDVLREYNNSKNIETLRNATLEPKAALRINIYKLDLLTPEDILYVFKNLDFSFEYGLSSFQTKQIRFVDFNDKAVVQIANADNPYRVYWEMAIRNVKAVPTALNIIVNPETTLPIFIGFDYKILNKFNDIEIRYLDDSRKTIIHAYRYIPSK